MQNKGTIFFKTVLTLCLVALLNSQLAASVSHRLIFYPKQGTFIKAYYQALKPHNGALSIHPLPSGIVPERLELISPQNADWSYQEAITPVNLTKAIGSPVKVDYDGHTISGILTGINDELISIEEEGNTTLLSLEESRISILNNKAEITINTNSDSPVSLLYFVDSIPSSIEHSGQYNEAENTLRISSALHVKNNSGVHFENAKIEAVIGNINLYQRPNTAPRFKLASLSESDNFIMSQSDEIYQFQLKNQHSLNSGEHASIPLLTTTLDAEKIYRYEHVNWANQRLRKQTPQPIDVILKVTNKTANPIPEGTIRLLANDSFIGESYIQATPPGATTEIPYGKAMDIRGIKITTDIRHIESKELHTSHEIQITNYKDTPVSVEVIEQVAHDSWSIVSSSHAYTKTDHMHIRFDLIIDAGETIEVQYDTKRVHQR